MLFAMCLADGCCSSLMGLNTCWDPHWTSQLGLALVSCAIGVQRVGGFGVFKGELI